MIFPHPTPEELAELIGTDKDKARDVEEDPLTLPISPELERASPPGQSSDLSTRSTSKDSRADVSLKIEPAADTRRRATDIPSASRLETPQHPSNVSWTRRRATAAPPNRRQTDFRLSVCSVYVHEAELEAERVSLTFKQAAKTKTIYALMTYSLFYGCVMLYVCASTKIVSAAYQLSDDQGTFLVSLGNIGDACGRLAWGAVIDRFGFKFTIMTTGTVTALLLVSIDPLMRLCGENGYATCLAVTWSLLCALTSGLFVVMASSVPHYFGIEFTNEIYSMLNMCYCMSVVILVVSQPAMTEMGKDHGFWVVFLIIAVLSALSSFAALFLPKITHVEELERRKNGSISGSRPSSSSRQLRENTHTNRQPAPKTFDPVHSRRGVSREATREDTLPLLDDPLSD